MCNLFFCKKSNRCKEWYLMIIFGKWNLYWKAFLCLSMVYYILLQTSTGIISLKNTTTNRHIESANLIYIALGIHKFSLSLFSIWNWYFNFSPVREFVCYKQIVNKMLKSINVLEALVCRVAKPTSKLKCNLLMILTHVCLEGFDLFVNSEMLVWYSVECLMFCEL